MADRLTYIVLFIVRVIVFMVIIYKHGWKAAWLGWAYALATAISPGLEVFK